MTERPAWYVFALASPLLLLSLALAPFLWATMRILDWKMSQEFPND